MKIYLVGGAVRDTIMGLDPKDRDYVVVGSSPEEMLSLGYQQVGASFPVFLKDGEEYALARTERKTGVGYKGFDTIYDNSVTLEDDLIRRDLTINSMAMDLDTGDIIDPYGGQFDIKDKALRHTSVAFAEDPVRVLRTARFAARYRGFDVHPDTIDLMTQVVPELATVPQERIWAEFEKGLAEKQPVKMFMILKECGAMSEDGPLSPYSQADIRCLLGVMSNHDMAVRFTFAAKGFILPEYERCRIPTDLALVSYTFNSFKQALLDYNQYNKAERLMMLDKMRAFSRPWLLEKCLEVLRFYGDFIEVTATINKISDDVEAAKTVPAAEIALGCKNGKEIKEKIFAARLAVM